MNEITQNGYQLRYKEIVEALQMHESHWDPRCDAVCFKAGRVGFGAQYALIGITLRFMNRNKSRQLAAKQKYNVVIMLSYVPPPMIYQGCSKCNVY